MICKECPQKADGKYGGPCTKCGNHLCPRHTHFYGDESNIAITRNARPECAICYTHRTVRGVLDYRNLLISGDYQHRDDARKQFTIMLTADGSRIT